MPLRMLLAALALLLLVPPAAAQSRAFATITEKQASFDEVAFFVQQAIVQKGFTVEATSHVSDMLARTARDVGATRVVYKSAIGLQFCSVKLAREMFEADPALITMCPLVIVVYEIAGKPGAVHVGYRSPPVLETEAGRKAMDAVRKTLDEIVAEAMQ